MSVRGDEATSASPSSPERSRGARFQFGVTAIYLAAGNALNLVTAVVLARWMDEVSFGRIMYAFATAAFLSLLTKAGLDQAIIYFAPRYEGFAERRRGLFAAAVGGSTALALACGLCIVAISAQLDGTIAIDGFSQDAGWISAMVVLLTVTHVLGAALNAVRRADLRALMVYIVFPGVFLTWVLLTREYSVDAALVGRTAALAATILGAAIALHALPLGGSLVRGSRDTSDVREWIRYAGPSLLSGVVLYLVEHLDVLMLGAISVPEEVSYYSVASRCITPLVLLRIAFGMVIEPRVARHHHHGSLTEQRARIASATSVYCRMVVLIMGLAIAARDLVPVVFGQSYRASTPSMVWLSVGYGVAAWLGVGGVLLNMTGAPRRELFNGVATLGLNILLCALLIPRYGAEGAAIATTLSLASMGVLRLVQVSLHLGWIPVLGIQVRMWAVVAGALLLGEVVASPLHAVASIALRAGVVVAAVVVDSLLDRRRTRSRSDA